MKTLKQACKEAEVDDDYYVGQMKNTKSENSFFEMKCKCGCSRNKVSVAPAECDLWVLVECKKCKQTLFYNGA